MGCSTPGFPVHHQLPELAQTVSIQFVMPSKHLILCCALLLLPSIFLSIRVFSNESDLCIRWPKYWSFASVLPMNIQDWSPLGWTGWISLQSKELSRAFSNTIVQKYQFFGIELLSWIHSVQFSHPYMTTGKTISLTRQNFVGKVMSLLLNILSRLVIIFLPRSKRLLMAFHGCSHHLLWFWSPEK